MLILCNDDHLRRKEKKPRKERRVGRVEYDWQKGGSTQELRIRKVEKIRSESRYIVISYYMKWVTTSWTDGSMQKKYLYP